ncbi:MarR family transcriptional regulator [Methanoregula formicica]|uniref:Putative transcriptional regulator n=1 Tax=Methanoregula formicica (strain DSM 22288 / NBRC 105244 / SMSP) TaxID=593750 RepID=L0HJ84_METFS|nr:MarR family transcriptional regulator [Methanoregula formicica]AGB03368.1 putative transcriptional regulator [Methanoregula formicica SMSP]
MRVKTIPVFCEEDDECISILVCFGMTRPVARTLVYLLNIKEGTMQEIEVSTGLYESEVSKALKYLEEQGWVRVTGKSPEGKGRVLKNFSLALPAGNILEIIADGKIAEIENQISCIRKMRTFIALGGIAHSGAGSASPNIAGDPPGYRRQPQ